MQNIYRTAALGLFDGVHAGHAALLKRVLQRSGENGTRPAVISFDVHPDNLVLGGEVALINSAPERKRIIKEHFGIDDVIFLRFTEELMKMDWESFLDLAVSRFGIRHFVVGYDFTFGYRGLGKTAQLTEYCERKGLGCDIIPPVYMDGSAVSSTRIRALIEEGKILDANRLLGHGYSVTGTVIHGLNNGEKLGFPTLNIKMPEHQVIPRFGVYAATVKTEDGLEYRAATDIGIKPTVDAAARENLVESNLFDFDRDIYGETVTVTLHKFMRPEQKFASFDELKTRIAADITDIREYFDEKFV